MIFFCFNQSYCQNLVLQNPCYYFFITYFPFYCIFGFKLFNTKTYEISSTQTNWLIRTCFIIPLQVLYDYSPFYIVVEMRVTKPYVRDLKNGMTASEFSIRQYQRERFLIVYRWVKILWQNRCELNEIFPEPIGKLGICF